MREPKTSSGRILFFQLYCVCGAVWEGTLPEVVADKIRRTFYQEHRHRAGHGAPDRNRRKRRRCGRCGAFGKGTMRLSS